MEDLRPDLLGEGEIQTDTRADFAKLIGVAHSTILFFSVGIGLSAAFALKTIEETRKLVNVIPYLSWQINIFAAYSGVISFLINYQLNLSVCNLVERLKNNLGINTREALNIEALNIKEKIQIAVTLILLMFSLPLSFFILNPIGSRFTKVLVDLVSEDPFLDWLTPIVDSSYVRGLICYTRTYQMSLGFTFFILDLRRVNIPNSCNQANSLFTVFIKKNLIYIIISGIGGVYVASSSEPSSSQKWIKALQKIFFSNDTTKMLTGFIIFAALYSKSVCKSITLTISNTRNTFKGGPLQRLWSVIWPFPIIPAEDQMPFVATYYTIILSLMTLPSLLADEITGSKIGKDFYIALSFGVVSGLPIQASEGLHNLLLNAFTLRKALSGEADTKQKSYLILAMVMHVSLIATTCALSLAPAFAIAGFGLACNAFSRLIDPYKNSCDEHGELEAGKQDKAKPPKGWYLFKCCKKSSPTNGDGETPAGTRYIRLGQDDSANLT